jgi:hypothetical protein
VTIDLVVIKIEFSVHDEIEYEPPDTLDEIVIEDA